MAQPEAVSAQAVAGEVPEARPSASADAGGAAEKAPLKRESSKGRFKVVAHMVLAMRRFQASLNPTYTYGKRPTSPEGWKKPTSDGEEVPEGRAGHRRTTSGGSEERYAYPDRGHKADYLLKPLPALPTNAS